MRKILTACLCLMLICSTCFSAVAEKAVLSLENPYTEFSDDFSDTAKSDSIWKTRWFNDLEGLTEPKVPAVSTNVTNFYTIKPEVLNTQYSVNVKRNYTSQSSSLSTAAANIHTGFLFEKGKNAKTVKFTSNILNNGESIYVWLGENISTSGILDSNSDGINDDLSWALVITRNASNMLTIGKVEATISSGTISVSSVSNYTSVIRGLTDVALNFNGSLQFTINFSDYSYKSGENIYNVKQPEIKVVDSNGTIANAKLPVGTIGQNNLLPSKITGFALSYKGTGNTSTAPCYDNTFTFDDVYINFETDNSSDNSSSESGTTSSSDTSSDTTNGEENNGALNSESFLVPDSQHVFDKDIKENVINTNILKDDFDQISYSKKLWKIDDNSDLQALNSKVSLCSKIENDKALFWNDLSGISYSDSVNAQRTNFYTVRNDYKKDCDVDFVSIKFKMTEKSQLFMYLGCENGVLKGISLNYSLTKGISSTLLSYDESTKDLTKFDSSMTWDNVSNSGFITANVIWKYNVETASYNWQITLMDENGNSAVNELDNTDANKLYKSFVNSCFSFGVVTDSSVNANITIDNILIEFDNDFDDELNYKSNNNLALHLQENTVSVQDKLSIQNALSKYACLPEREKSIFKDCYCNMQNLLVVIADRENVGDTDSNILRASDDYTSDWSENFENGLRKWVNDGEQYVGNFFEIVNDEKLNSNVVRLKYDSILTPKPYTLPVKALFSKVSYKLKLEGSVDTTNRANLFLTYKDSLNYQCLQLTIDSAGTGTWKCSPLTYADGKPTTAVSVKSLNGIDLHEWSNVLIIRNSSSVIITITQGDKSFSYSTSIAYEDSTFAVKAPKKSQDGQALLIDDVSFTLEKGDWDLDETVNRPLVYYSSNTTYKTDDTVMLTGVNLYSTVSKVAIARVPDVYDESDPKYLKQTSYTKGNLRDDSLYFNKANAYWPDEESQADLIKNVDIIQWTNDSLKFKCPHEIENGVWALRLYAREGEDLIVYLNNAVIDYCVGSDGITTYPGGTIQLVGKNLALYPDNAKDSVSVQLKGDNNEKYTFSLADKTLSVDSTYSVKISLPQNIPVGSYELTAYNGYGNDTCWSEPITVEVSKNIVDTWPDYAVSVGQLGATGIKDDNATPYFVKALAMLEENGGGVLIVPEGWYQLQTEIFIPENVKIRGQGIGKTIIFFSQDKWKYLELPQFVIGITKNVSISDITFYASRIGKLIYGMEDAAENVYINNVRYIQNPFVGNPTEAAGGSGAKLFTSAELYLMATGEQKLYNSAALWFADKCTNLQLIKFDYELQGTSTPAKGFIHYSKIVDCDISISDSGWNRLAGSHNLTLNTTFSGCCSVLTGNGSYYSGNFFNGDTRNNHELLVADEGLKYGKDGSGIIQSTDDPLVYKITNNSYGENEIAGLQIYVITGQGAMQSRYIVSNAGDTLTIDNPFEVSPNRNSRVTFATHRQDHYFYNNVFKNGSAGGYFGNVSGTVYDSNTHIRHGRFYFWSHNFQPVWYVSIVNDKFEDPFYYHTLGTGDNSGETLIDLYCQGGQNTLCSVIVKDNTLDGYRIRSYNGGAKESQKNYIIENNEISNSTYGISCNCSTYSCDGMLLKNNIFNNVIMPYSSPILLGVGFNNEKSKRILLVDSYNEELNKLGDVNLDGIVSIKDSTVIRYYILGLSELNDIQLKNADVDGNGDVNLRDSTKIKNYLLGYVSLDN